MKDIVPDKQVMLAKVRELLFEQIKAGAVRKARKCPCYYARRKGRIHNMLRMWKFISDCTSDDLMGFVVMVGVGLLAIFI